MEEKIIWKRLIYQGKDYGDFYLVSNTGEIKGVKTGKIRRKNINHEGYYFVSGSLGSRKNKITFKVHKAVAETFIKNSNHYPIINHKDGNKLNNHIHNLEWCTHQYNRIHAINNINPKMSCKSVVQLDKNTYEIINIFDSITKAQEFFGVYKYTGTICDCIRGRSKTAYGYYWILEENLESFLLKNLIES